MKIELEDSDIARIAEAVAKVLGGKAPAAAPEEKATAKGTKAKDKPANAPAEKPEPDADAILKRRGEVLEALKALGAKIGKDEAKKLVSNYAPTMGEVKPGDLDSLEADIKAAAEAADKPKAEEDDY